MVMAGVCTRTSDTVNCEEEQPHRNPELVLVPRDGIKDELPIYIINLLWDSKPRWV